MRDFDFLQPASVTEASRMLADLGGATGHLAAIGALSDARAMLEGHRGTRVITTEPLSSTAPRGVP